MATFGVTAAVIGDELHGFESAVTALSDRLDRWVAEHAGELEVDLRQQGYDIEVVEGYGATDALYLMCRNYLIATTVARLIRSSSQQDPDLARTWEKRADGIHTKILTHTESLTKNWDPNKQRGSWGTNVRLTGDVQRDSAGGSSYSPASPARTGFWNKDTIF